MAKLMQFLQVKVMAKYLELLGKIPQRNLAAAESTVKKVGTLAIAGTAAPFILAFDSSLKEATQDEQMAVIDELAQLNHRQLKKLARNLKLQSQELKTLQQFCQRSATDKETIVSELNKMQAESTTQHERQDKKLDEITTQVRELRADVGKFLLDGMAAKALDMPIPTQDEFIKQQVARLKSGEADGVIRSVTSHLQKAKGSVKYYSGLLARAYLVKGDGYFDRDDFSLARKQFRQSVSHARASADKELLAVCLCGLGAAMGMLGDHNKALELLNQAIRLAPKLAEAYYNRGIARSDKGDLDGAIADYDKTIKLNHNDAWAYNARGSSRSDKGDLDGAIADYDKAVNLNPEFAEAYYNRGNARSDKGDLDGAIADYDKTIKLNPNDAWAYHNRGIARSDKGDLDGAIADYDKAVSLSPNYANAYNNRGNARWKKGDLDGAIEDYTQGIKLNPNDAVAYYNRGNARYKKGDLAGAIEDFNQAIKLNPNYAEAMANLGMAFMRKKDTTNARYWLEEALKHKDALPDKGERIRQLLQSLK